MELLRELYDKNWLPAGYESIEHEQARREAGWKLLEEFYEANKDPWIKPAFLERNFHLKIGEYSFTGRIDRIDKLEDGTYEVIDYKTGRMRSGMKLEKDLQLSLYALACRDVYKIRASRLSLYFLESNEKISTTRTNAELDGLKNDVESLAAAIAQSDFMPTPGYHCNYCDFKLIGPAV